MQPINRMKIEFESKSVNESFARIVAAAFASQLDPTIEELADLKTAVSEAVTNAIIHGYEQQEGLIFMSREQYTARNQVRQFQKQEKDWCLP
jgi:stage II sporulation protein AB (anti-sigma F factor)